MYHPSSILYNQQRRVRCRSVGRLCNVEAMTDVRCSLVFLGDAINPQQRPNNTEQREIVSNTCLVNRQSLCLIVCKHCRTGINATIDRQASNDDDDDDDCE